jgi:RHS repeat-associated protein
MLSAFAPWSADECISAFESEGKKPHQGVAPQNRALHQGIAWSNSTTALGLRGSRLETRVRSRCTGKERDAESGLDMFGARYYGSSLGRFMTPDWAAGPNPVPYATFGDPQTLNLYGYVRNNPLSRTDPNGHCDVDGEHHNSIWCAAHALGITETKKETAAREAQEKKDAEAVEKDLKEHPERILFLSSMAAWQAGVMGGVTQLQMGPGAALTAEAGVLANANYAQTFYSQTFSAMPEHLQGKRLKR